jgi:benzoyl-CoA reductase subunit C
MFCPFCRDSLAQGLLGRFDYAEGVTLTQSCIQYRQTFSSWRSNVPSVKWDYYVPMPNDVQSPHARKAHYAEIQAFRTFLSALTGKELTDAMLHEATDTIDENRRLLRQLFDYRKESNPKVTGVEALYASITAQFVDKKEHNEQLKKVLAALPARQMDRKEGVRFMTIGSENDDIAFMAMVESVGFHHRHRRPVLGHPLLLERVEEGCRPDQAHRRALLRPAGLPDQGLPQPHAVRPRAGPGQGLQRARRDLPAAEVLRSARG